MTYEAFAHGRVNLIGEHTDYNGGFVLPTCIPQKTEVRLTPRADRFVQARSTSYGMGAAYELGREHADGSWLDYVRGVTALLARRGHGLPFGFDVEIKSDVPNGSGLSSSAALEIALLRALNTAFELNLDGLAMARLGQAVENEFVGARVGIMDQLICSLGCLGEALFVDTRSLEARALPLPLDQIDLLVINSGVSHNHAAGDYNQRRAECEAAAERLNVSQLRDVSIEELPRLAALPEMIGRRARHVITENARVLAAVDALQTRNFERLGTLFTESHRSQRDDYAVSVPEIDLLVDLACAEEDVYGARLTGGGFGGSIVALTRVGRARVLGARIVKFYQERTRRIATLMVPVPLAPET